MTMAAHKMYGPKGVGHSISKKGSKSSRSFMVAARKEGYAPARKTPQE